MAVETRTPLRSSVRSLSVQSAVSSLGPTVLKLLVGANGLTPKTAGGAVRCGAARPWRTDDRASE